MFLTLGQKYVIYLYLSGSENLNRFNVAYEFIGGEQQSLIDLESLLALITKSAEDYDNNMGAGIEQIPSEGAAEFLLFPQCSGDVSLGRTDTGEMKTFNTKGEEVDI